MQAAQDFHTESSALAALIAPLSEAAFEKPTQFKGWTINMVLRHLQVWNIAADLALSDGAAFDAFLGEMATGIQGGRLPDFEAAYLDRLGGQKLCTRWVQQFETMTPRFAAADPKHRVKWVGPDMSVISAITARLMETWAHGQAIYDVLGVDRIDEDRIGNIVRLGVNTYGWTWKNRRMDAPGPMPVLRLIAPSGVLWEYGEPSDSGIIEGSATAFCQVVTQCRNVADTALKVYGDVAQQWMAAAQCFAGPPQVPPAKGLRYKAG
jgi:uncharacterized protein (TIGR03084 family)